MSSKTEFFTPQQTIYLREDYRDEPEKMIDDFCHLFTIEEYRTMLWRMTCAFLSSDQSDNLDKDQRGDYMLCYELMSALIEASYLIDTKNQIETTTRNKKKKTSSKKK